MSTESVTIGVVAVVVGAGGTGVAGAGVVVVVWRAGCVPGSHFDFSAIT